MAMPGGFSSGLSHPLQPEGIELQSEVSVLRRRSAVVAVRLCELGPPHRSGALVCLVLRSFLRSLLAHEFCGPDNGQGFDDLQVAARGSCPFAPPGDLGSGIARHVVAEQSTPQVGAVQHLLAAKALLLLLDFVGLATRVDHA